MRFKWASAALISAILLAGCAGGTVGVHNSASTSGASYNSASIHAELGTNAYFGALFLGYIAVGVHDNYRRGSDDTAGRALPPLAADRAITERDCTQPMPQPSANLRCK